MNFGQNQKIRFMGVKNFWTCSTTTFGHLHSIKLTSLNEILRFKKKIQRSQSVHDMKKLAAQINPHEGIECISTLILKFYNTKKANIK